MTENHWRAVFAAGVLAVALLAHTRDAHAQACSGTG